MEFLLLGFFSGLSLILAIGAQNIFVIEQGLKKQHTFLVCLVCSISDLILIFFGIFLFHYFVQYFTLIIELVLNILLIGWFKYRFFFINSFIDKPINENIIIPLAISFFTFQQIALLFDIRDKIVKPLPFLDHLFFVSFFTTNGF